MSTVIVVGNVTRDPELRYTANGKAACSFNICENKGKGEDKVAHFYDVACFGQLAENVSESILKGARVIISGSLEQRCWDDKATGQKRSKVEIVAWNIGPDLSWATCVVTRNERSE